MKKTVSIILIFTSSICHSSPRYKLGQCTYCKFEDETKSTRNLIYKVISVDEKLKTYTVQPLSNPMPKRRMELLTDPRKMNFDELDNPKPQGQTPKCTMTPVDCAKD